MIASVEGHVSSMLTRIAGSVGSMNKGHETIGERVRIARERKGMSALELSKAVGVTRSAIYQIESGATRSPTPQTLWKIAEATGHNPLWLMSGEGVPDAARKIIASNGSNEQHENPDNISGFAYIKWVTVGHKLGQSIWFTSPDDPLTIPSEILRSIDVQEDDAVAYKAASDAMFPTISSGDTLILDTSDRRMLQGRILAVLYMGEVIVRRTHMEPDGTLVLIADSDRWPPIRVPQELQSSISVIGRVRYRMGSTGF